MLGVDAQTGADGSTLCGTCGLCCDGTLFNRTLIAPEEAPRAVAGKLRVFELEGKLFASQPCSFHDGGACSIYADRFATCRGFRCRLLRKLDRGDLHLSEATARVVEARRLIETATKAAAAVGSPNLSRDFRAKAADWSAIEDPGLRRGTAVAQLAIVALGAFLERHFHKDRRADKP